MQQNELQNARVQNLGSAPSGTAQGLIYYDSTAKKFKVRNDVGWYDPTDRATHTGQQPSSSISDLASVVKGYKLDDFAAPAGPLSVGGQRVTNGATPTAAGDLTTKAFVENLVNGLDWKASVRAATTGNITLSGLQTIDGISVIAGDRVLCKDQTSASTRGIYIVSSGAWTRATDADVGGLTSGATVMVTEGTVNGDQQWRLITDDPISVGTTAQTWTQVGAVVSYSGSNGVQVNGAVVSLDTAVAVRKAAGTIGDNSATAFVVTHSLNTLDVTVGIYEVATGAEWDADVTHSSVNAVTINFTTAPTAGQFRVVVHG